MTEAKTIAAWPLNRRETLRVSLSEFNGHPIIDARVWFDDGGGCIKPGRKGLTLGVKHLPKLVDAMTKLLAEAQVRGLVGLGGE